jgi:DNA-binding IclR family transcriptional regulator
LRNEEYTVRAVERAIDILKLFSKENNYNLTQISSLTGLSKATVLRLLNTLVNGNILKYDMETKKYSLGYLINILGHIAFESLELRKISKPYLEELSEKTGLITHLGVLQGENVLIIEKISPSYKKNFIEMVSKVGGIVPIYCTGVGKVLMSRKSDEYIRGLLSNVKFINYSDNTAKNVDEFIDKLKIVRERGYAVNFGEHEPYLKCITYPIYDANKEIAAALSVSGLIEEYKDIDEGFLHEANKNTVNKISRELGYSI